MFVYVFGRVLIFLSTSACLTATRHIRFLLGFSQVCLLVWGISVSFS